jgi:putative transposase
MGRIARRHLVEENTVNHCTWRSHNHGHVFATDDEKSKFLELLRRYKARFGVLVLSYCVMGTHPHVICIATKGQRAFSAFWKGVNQAYARWYNRKHARRGQVVMDRMSSPQIQDDRYLLTAMRYGDLNPVRAGLVRSAKDWRWSSHRHYAYGVPDDLVDSAPAFLHLGRTPAECRRAYLHLFAAALVFHLLVRRPDLVDFPFIGDELWIRARMARVTPPSSA